MITKTGPTTETQPRWEAILNYLPSLDPPRVEYAIKGVKGSSCENISALLEQLGPIEHEERTGEYYERDTDANVLVSR